MFVGSAEGRRGLQDLRRVKQRVNIIDTPGHVDFTAEVERSLRVLDGAIAVFCGVAGVQPQSETVWRQASKYGVPRIAFVKTRWIRVGADFDGAIDSMRQKLGANAWPILIPLGKEDYLKGQIDVLNQKAVISDSDQVGSTYEIVDIPAECKAIAEKAYQDLVEQMCDLDEEVGMLFLEEKPITKQDLKAAIRRQTIA